MTDQFNNYQYGNVRIPTLLTVNRLKSDAGAVTSEVPIENPESDNISILLINATDLCGKVIIVLDAADIDWLPDYAYARIYFNKAYDNIPTVILQKTYLEGGSYCDAIVNTEVDFFEIILTDNSALANGETFQYNYLVVENKSL
jgi:hypothetical protein